MHLLRVISFAAVVTACVADPTLDTATQEATGNGKSSCVQQLATTQNSLLACQAQNASLTTSLGTCNTSLASATSLDGSLQTTNTQLQAQVADLQNQLAAAQAQLAAAQAQVADLQSQLASAQQTNTDLQGQLTLCTNGTTLANCKADYASCENAVTYYETKQIPAYICFSNALWGNWQNGVTYNSDTGRSQQNACYIQYGLPAIL